jgi:phosphatidylserine decarboxylase
MRIAPQGFRYIGLFAVLALAAFLVAPIRILSWPLIALALFVAYFFRDPNRTPPADEKLLVSPGDGKVVDVGPAPSDPESSQVGIFLSIFDVHVNRSPLAAVVERIVYTPGRFLAAYRKEAGSANERNELRLRDGDYRVTVRQIAGVLARRIVCAAKESEALARGERFGLIQFGSRMEVELPRGTDVLVKVGDRVRGGETPIGRRP